jgi:ABC-type sugar transport system ATPase subunit
MSASASPSSSSAALLVGEGLHKRYGGVHALRGARLAVAAGEVHALVGENGSGKSTLLKILTGQIQADAGTITVDGRPAGFRTPTDALRAGIATVTQETTLVQDLSVAENVFLGHRMVKRGPVIDWRTTRGRALAALRRLGLEVDPSLPVRRLRPDQQQMVEIARALSIDARVLILDEPTSSLTDDEVASLFGLVRKLREHGVATIFVSHRLREVFDLVDRVTVLRDGRTVAEAPIEELDAARLIHLMVGRALEDIEPPVAQEREGAAALRVRGLTMPRGFADIDLEVAPGEIVGLAGLVGAGRSELLEALFGLHRPTAGAVEVGGERVAFKHPRQSIRNRVGFVPADRKLQGLVLDMSVRENLVMASTSRLSRARPPAARRELPIVRSSFEGMQIRAASARVPVATLSGGNQQKVVLGKWLATNPLVLMLDEPTRGVDVGAKSEIYRLLFDVAESGVGILVSSSENAELLTLCDRILVMFRGRIVADLSRDEATEARIARFAGGHR